MAKKKAKAVKEKEPCPPPAAQKYFPKNVIEIADNLYKSREPTLMPALADALGDVNEAEFQEHFLKDWQASKDDKGNYNGVCPKGCHQLDVILGKS